MEDNPYRAPETETELTPLRFPLVSTIFNTLAATAPFVVGTIFHGPPNRVDRVAGAFAVLVILPFLLAFMLAFLGGIVSKASVKRRFYVLLLACNVVVGVLLVCLSLALVADGIMRQYGTPVLTT